MRRLVVRCSVAVLSPASQLHQLFTEMFSADELRRFLRYHVPIPGILDALPGPSTSALEFAFAAEELLRRWNAVDAGLFEALRRERPRRISEINSVACAFGLIDADRNDARAPQDLPAAPYRGPTPRYRRKDAELTSKRLLALYAALERGEAGKIHVREITELHRSLRGEFAELQPGDLLASGRYLLLSDLPRSSAPGIIWHTQDLRLDREVALRLFNTAHDDPRFRAYVRGQAHAMARLQHPNVAQVLDPNAQDEPYYGYSTEFLGGGRLLDRLKNLSGDVRMVLALTVKLADGLALAHAHGLVHGALEIHCVDFADDGEPKLRDFGLSTVAADSRISRGMVPFLAPEFILNGDLSPAIDQYSLAKIAVACLSGKETPPASTTDESLASIGIHGALATALRRALHDDPAQRFPNIQAFRGALDAVGQKVGSHG